MNSKIECASMILLGLDPDAATMPLDYLFTDGQTDARARVIVLVVQTLKDDKYLIKELRIEDIRGLIADGTITGGMIPKVETCIYALERGVEGVVILDGKVPHAVLIELLTDYGAGTLIMR